MVGSFGTGEEQRGKDRKGRAEGRGDIRIEEWRAGTEGIGSKGMGGNPIPSRREGLRLPDVTSHCRIGDS